MNFSALQNVALWPVSEVPSEQGNVGYRGQTGKHLLVLSLTGFDPNQTCSSERARLGTRLLRTNSEIPAGAARTCSNQSMSKYSRCSHSVTSTSSDVPAAALRNRAISASLMCA
jgi:hypothetical protein